MDLSPLWPPAERGRGRDQEAPRGERHVINQYEQVGGRIELATQKG
jgi:hypothetical protein